MHIRLNRDKVYTATLARNITNYLYDNTDKRIFIISSSRNITNDLINKIVDFIRKDQLLQITAFGLSVIRLDNGNRIHNISSSNRDFGFGYNIDCLVVNNIDDLNDNVVYHIDRYILPTMKARQNSKSIITY